MVMKRPAGMVPLSLERERGFESKRAALFSLHRN